MGLGMRCSDAMNGVKNVFDFAVVRFDVVFNVFEMEDEMTIDRDFGNETLLMLRKRN